MPLNRLAFTVMIAVLVGAMPSANACGICKEDDRAAVYSQAAMEQSQAQPTRYEFVVLKVTHGPLTPTNITKVRRWLSNQQGIVASTVNISQQQRSIGFLFEKQSQLQPLLDNLQKSFTDFTFLKRDYET
ncbi:MAG: hypothetical protein HY465_04785 [Deltaproteobacteria bacterium]|nr:hypothetical protein [Deltaproteobacteria bacterium]